jgi:hypothetical protein
MRTVGASQELAAHVWSSQGGLTLSTVDDRARPGDPVDLAQLGHRQVVKGSHHGILAGNHAAGLSKSSYDPQHVRCASCSTANQALLQHHNTGRAAPPTRSSIRRSRQLAAHRWLRPELTMLSAVDPVAQELYLSRRPRGVTRHRPVGDSVVDLLGMFGDVFRRKRDRRRKTSPQCLAGGKEGVSVARMWATLPSPSSSHPPLNSYVRVVTCPIE